MPSFSGLITHLTKAGFYYTKNPRHASYHFNQDSNALYRNQPRLPFEFYINFNINRVGTAGAFFSKFFQANDRISPLVKSIDMPAFKIQTEALNQYNRKRLSQTRIDFDPIKVVLHDVCDGKTLKFWDFYYRYYFGDGTEAGQNERRQPTGAPGAAVTETFLKTITPPFHPNLSGLTASIKNVSGAASFLGFKSPTNQDGDKSKTQNIVADTLNNHHFGFNLPVVQNIRNLIDSIEIFQVHGGKFNQITLVNPRIVAFTHDTLNYAVGDKTLEITMTFEYEYAYYTIQNLPLGGVAENNSSSTEYFRNGEFLELPALAFNAKLLDFVESNNPFLQSDNPIIRRIGKQVQSTLGSVTGAVAAKAVHRVTSSALDGLAKISPTPHNPVPITKILTRPFASTPSSNSLAYKDVNRTGSA